MINIDHPTFLEVGSHIILQSYWMFVLVLTFAAQKVSKLVCCGFGIDWSVSCDFGIINTAHQLED